MATYVLLAWAPDDLSAATHAAGHARRLRGERWSRSASGRGWALWTRARAPTVTLLPKGRGAILGSCLPREAGDPAAAGSLVAQLPCDPLGAARRLACASWGSRVALLGDETGRITSVWRDPSGMVEAFTWRLREDVDVVSDAVWDLPWGLSPPRLSINWDRLALGLADPVAAIANPPLDGFVAVGAGMLRSLGSTPSTIGVWRPGDHTADPRMDAVSASAALSKTVDQCTAALVSRSGRYLGEISGGLDSAIVAASVVRSGLQGRAAGWLNVWSRLGGADERSYARHVARHLGVPLREVELMPAVFSDEDYVGLLDGVRPPLTAASREYDRCVRGLAEALGAEALLTGEGGDAVLFQSPSPLVVADLLRIRGPAAFLGPELAQYARRARRSVWSLAATAIAALGGRSEWPQARIPLAGATEPAVPWRHPWLEGIEALPPAKRLHVLAVTNAQVHTADSARRQVAEPLNPLLAQPVVELCLSLPTPLLTLGARDRGLARRAFRDRLPAEIIERRSKGDMALFYGQVVSRGLPWLREHLLGGCLVEAGVLDARRLEPALTSERLAWRGGASAVLGAALTETWVRHWQRRVPDTIGAVRGPHPESRAALA